MRKKSLFLFLFSAIFFLRPGKIFAYVNIINDWSGPTLNKIQENFGSSAFVVVAADPNNQDLINAINSYSFNWVIRGHSHWLQIGTEMLNNPQSAAGQWAGFLSQINKPVYFEPWNEPARLDIECGNLSLQECAGRIKNYLNALAGALPENARLTTPAFDPYHPNTPELIRLLGGAGFFSSYPFQAVSIHVYSPEKAANYQQISQEWGANINRFLFTETGVLTNGESGAPVYEERALCDMYCNQIQGKTVVDFWRSQGNVIGWALFSFAPGDHAGVWDLWDAQCVIDALKGSCHCDDCQEKQGSRAALRSPCPEPIVLDEYRHCFGFNPIVCPALPQFSDCRQNKAGGESEAEILGNRERYEQRTNLGFDFSGAISGSPPAEPVTAEFDDYGYSPVRKTISNFFLSVANYFSGATPASVFGEFFNNPGGAITSLRLPVARRLPFSWNRAIMNSYVHCVLEKRCPDTPIGYANLEENGKVFCHASKVRDTARPVYVSEIGCSNTSRTLEAITQTEDGAWNISQRAFTPEQIEFCENRYGPGHAQVERITGGDYLRDFSGFPPEAYQFCEHWSGNRFWALMTPIAGGVLPSMVASFVEAGAGPERELPQGYGSIANPTRPNLSLSIWNALMPRERTVELSTAESLPQAQGEIREGSEENRSSASTITTLINWFRGVSLTFLNTNNQSVNLQTGVNTYDFFNRQGNELSEFFKYSIPRKFQNEEASPYQMTREGGSEAPDVIDEEYPIFWSFLRPYKWRDF